MSDDKAVSRRWLMMTIGTNPRAAAHSFWAPGLKAKKQTRASTRLANSTKVLRSIS